MHFWFKRNKRVLIVMRDGTRRIVRYKTRGSKDIITMRGEHIPINKIEMTSFAPIGRELHAIVDEGA